MKLLILTQTIDKNDPMLGFMHTWVEEFATQFESIKVLCLNEGEHNLPENIEVFCLGKSEGRGRVTYLKRFYKYVWSLRSEYDVVFVHMNQEYVLLAGWLWKLMGKKVTMWRNHYAGSMLTDIASRFCDKIFCTSKYSYTTKYKKTVLMPVGVPEDMFTENNEVQRKQNSILSLTRLSPSKKIEQLLDAVSVLKERRVEFSVTLCGSYTKENEKYVKKLHEKVRVLGLQNNIVFKEGVPYSEVPKLLWEHEVSVNQSPSGMYDKTIFEAMLCGNLVLSCNENLRGEIDDMFLFKENNVKEIANKLQMIFMLSQEEKELYRKAMIQYAHKNHSLNHLTEKLYKALA